MNGVGELRIGSDAHKDLFCRTFVATHRRFEPEQIAWPVLSLEQLGFLRGLPVWNEAARTEAETAVKVQALGEVERDPTLAEAISLQGYEESRHAAVIRLLTKHYGIPVTPFPEPPIPRDPVWTFLSVGYGECIDSFFAFGLFEIGRRSRLLPEALLDIFEGIVQEEARHVLFLVNWAAFLRRRASAAMRPFFDARRAAVIGGQVVEHVRHALAFGGDSSQEGFEMGAHREMGDITAREFLRLCLAENDRRLAVYDPRLLRPRLVPIAVRAALTVLPRGARTTGGRS